MTKSHGKLEASHILEESALDYLQETSVLAFALLCFEQVFYITFFLSPCSLPFGLSFTFSKIKKIN